MDVGCTVEHGANGPLLVEHAGACSLCFLAEAGLVGGVVVSVWWRVGKGGGGVKEGIRTICLTDSWMPSFRSVAPF